MRRPPDRRDEAASSILGFIVGFVLLAGSMAAVGYVMLTTADSGPSEEDAQLGSSATRVIETLTGSPGHPSDWHTSKDMWNDPPDQIGLLREDRTAASLDKIGHLQNGSINSTILTRSNNLLADDVRLDVTGTIVPVPAMRPPSTEVHAVVNGTIDGDMDEISTSSTTDDALEVYEGSNHGFTSTTHAWTWRQDQHPDNGLGNTFVDDPWHVETQAISVMAGLAATYSFADLNAHASMSAAAEAAHANYTHPNNPDNGLSRFHVVTRGEPKTVPHASDVNGGQHTLAVGYCKQTGSQDKCRDTGSGDGSIGHWRTVDGMRSYALLDKVDATGAGGANLTFDHLLKPNDDEVTECHEVDGSADCVKIRPAIRFWNRTANGGNGGWTRLDDDAACNPTPAWNHSGDAETTSKWEQKTVNLCEAVDNGTSDLWLAFEWYTECYNSLEQPAPCSLVRSDDNPQGVRGWFIDNVELEVDGEVLYKTDFEPGGSRETLFAGHGVDHDFHNDGGQPENIVGPIRHFVKNEGNVVAYEPAKEGHWLGSVGLQAVQRSETRNVETVDGDRLVMRMPHELPRKHPSYDASAVGWQTNESPLNSTSVKNAGFQALDTVQQNTPSSSDPVATLISGIPFEDGGRVSAIAYDVTSMNDTQLRDDLADNLHAATVFLDPTFDMDGASVDGAEGEAVAAPSRVVLAEVTEDGDYQIPLEITVYAWTQATG